MAFFDKLKETASGAAQKAKEQYEANKQAREEKKAAEEAYKTEMTGKARELADSIINKIEKNYRVDLDGFFSNNPADIVMRYTKEFFEKILLPANSMNKTCISMYPYIDGSQAKKLLKSFGYADNVSKVIVHIKDKESQEFMLTYDEFYFKLALPQDKSFFAVGSVPCTKISLFSLVKNEEEYLFLCDDVEIGRLKIIDGKEDDFITLNKFFEDIKNQDLEITDEEVDKTIQKKIGTRTYEEVKKYFIEDDELILFFAWGGGSDYTVCTTNQIITMDKEAFGYTANAKQFFYDDIKSVQAIQNTNDTSLTGMLIDAALASVFKTCTLKITAVGAFESIAGIKNIEADRIVAIYNRFKKDIKKADRESRTVQPQVIVQQQQSQPDVLEQLERLARLKESGVLTEEEFNQKKVALLERI